MLVKVRALQDADSATSSLSRPAHSKYRPDIDGLRAVAILSVLAFHAAPNRFPGGLIGVDVFFVISGFLISTIIVEGLKRDDFTFAWFFSRRIRRIFPALLVILVASFAAGWFLLLSNAFAELGKQIFAASIFISNFALWWETGYFEIAAATKPLLHLWSLGIEEQFYLVWPLTLWLAWRWRLNLLAVVLTLGAISFALNVWTVRHDEVAAFYAPYTRAWELLAGALVACLAIEKRLPLHPAKIVRDAQSVLGAALIAAGILLITQDRYFPGWWALLPTAGAALVISAGADAWFNRKILSLRVLVWIGLISYPIYLWHWPLLSFARIAEDGAPSAAIRVAAIAASIVLAWLTYRLVETPIRFGAQPRAKTIALLIAMAAVGALGLVTYAVGDFNFRFPKDIRYVTGFSYDQKSYRDGSCFLREAQQDFEDFAACPSAVSPDRQTIFLWGDSHAAHLYPGYAAVFGADFNIVQRNASACPPLLGLDVRIRPYCRSINDKIFDLIAAQKPDKVVLAAEWWAADWRDRLAKTITRLREVGIGNIDLIGDVPTWNRPLPALLYRAYMLDPNHRVPVRMAAELRPESFSLNAVMRAFAAEMKTNYISTTDILCDADGCLTRLGDTGASLVQWDVAHLTTLGSRYLVSKFPHEPPAAKKSVRD